MPSRPRTKPRGPSTVADDDLADRVWAEVAPALADPHADYMEIANVLRNQADRIEQLEDARP